jgi:hypothetical protein
VGSTGSDYWWAVNSDGTPNNNGRGVFVMLNNWGSPNTPALRAGGIRIAEITDGNSNTMLVGEKHVQQGALGGTDTFGGDGSVYNGDKGHAFRGAGPSRTLARSPTDSATNIFGSWHTGICQFVFADGSVKALRNNLDATTLGRMADRADNGVVQFD